MDLTPQMERVYIDGLGRVAPGRVFTETPKKSIIKLDEPLLIQNQGYTIVVVTMSVHNKGRMIERGVSWADVQDAARKPLDVGTVKTDSKGRRSVRVIGQTATINVNPDTGNLITVWPTGKRTRKKYGGTE